MKPENKEIVKQVQLWESWYRKNYEFAEIHLYNKEIGILITISVTWIYVDSCLKLSCNYAIPKNV